MNGQCINIEVEAGTHNVNGERLDTIISKS